MSGYLAMRGQIVDATIVAAPLRSRARLTCQKGPMVLIVRTIGIARARVKIGLANLAYNQHAGRFRLSSRPTSMPPLRPLDR
jgi:hypothetical protein